jgi:tetratricopeptide (TPR) repeat protein
MAGGSKSSDQAESRRVEQLLDQGLVQYALGNLDAAVSYWREAADVEPANDRAHDYLRTVGVPLDAVEPDFDADERTEAMPAISEDHLAAVAAIEAGDEDLDSDTLAPPFAREHTYDDESVRTDDLDVEPVVPDVEIMLRDARSAEAAGKFEEAHKSAVEALKRDPEREETQKMVASLRERLKQSYLAALRPLERVPVLRATDASILELSLDPIGGFLISQIDGEITIEELLTILGTFDEFRVLGSLHFFLESGIIELR